MVGYMGGGGEGLRKFQMFKYSIVQSMKFENRSFKFKSGHEPLQKYALKLTQ